MLGRNFAIDQGNTSIKIAEFNNDQLVSVTTYKDIYDAREIFAQLAEHPTMICSVSGNLNEIKGIIGGGDRNIRLLDYNTEVPLDNQYQSKKTLGMDRLAAVCGAKVIFPKSDCLVVDFGTCITYDYISADSIYNGGAISPGMKMRFEAMNKFTNSLPYVRASRGLVELVGVTTEKSLQSGVINGITAEVEGFIEKYREISEGMEVLFCGGDSVRFESITKAPIFAAPNLVVVGLNSILRHNEDSI